MIQYRPGFEDSARTQACRDLVAMFKECEVDEVRRYCISYINDDDEVNGSIAKIKEKINRKFGKTAKQEDKEVRTRFKGMQLAGEISEYADYMRKQKKKQLVSLKREPNSEVPPDILDKWLIKGLLEDLKDQNRTSEYEFENLWSECELNKWSFENCLKTIVDRISEKEKEANDNKTNFGSEELREFFEDFVPL